jgi:hypothetical protein
MSVSYTWAITRLYTKDITDSGTTYTDVVKRVVGTLTATSSSTSNTQTHQYDIDLKNPSDWSAFTAYASLNESTVQTWIETRLTSDTVTAIKGHLAGQLEYDDEIENTTVKGNGTDETADGFVASFPWS